MEPLIASPTRGKTTVRKNHSLPTTFQATTKIRSKHNPTPRNHFFHERFGPDSSCIKGSIEYGRILLLTRRN